MKLSVDTKNLCIHRGPSAIHFQAKRQSDNPDAFALFAHAGDPTQLKSIGVATRRSDGAFFDHEAYATLRPLLYAIGGTEAEFEEFLQLLVSIYLEVVKR